jgi:RNA polymerase sigma factor (TIGR02999 family)
MSGSDPQSVSRLLDAVRRGDREALNHVAPLVYAELRRLAGRYLESERSGHTLQPTALVHEAWIRLAGQGDPDWRNRAHFVACAAHAMRHVLVDHARARAAEKRGSDPIHVSLSEATPAAGGSQGVDLMGLDAAMERLAVLSPRQARVVELKYFGGLTNEEVATVLEVSASVVRKDWTVARAWLRRELEPSSGG